MQGFAQRVPQIGAYANDVVGILQKIAAISPTWTQDAYYTPDQVSALDALYSPSDATLSGPDDAEWVSWNSSNC